MKLRSISIYGLFVSKKVITITTFLISLVVAIRFGQKKQTQMY